MPEDLRNKPKIHDTDQLPPGTLDKLPSETREALLADDKQTKAMNAFKNNRGADVPMPKFATDKQMYQASVWWKAYDNPTEKKASSSIFDMFKSKSTSDPDSEKPAWKRWLGFGGTRRKARRRKSRRRKARR